MGTWEHRVILEGNKGTRTPCGTLFYNQTNAKIMLGFKTSIMLSQILSSRLNACHLYGRETKHDGEKSGSFQINFSYTVANNKIK